MPLPTGEYANVWTRTTPPGGAHTGDLWVNQTTGEIRVYNGTDFVPSGVPVVTVTFFGAKGNGVTNDRAAFAAADAALGGQTGTIYVPPGTYLIGSSLTLGSKTTVTLAPGAVLSPSGGATLTIGGQVDAGLYQVFTGAGTISLTRPQTIYPEWWGAVPDVQTAVSWASITSTQTALTLAGASLTSADIGKTIVVCGAGAAGAPLVTTISAVGSATTCTVALAASTTVSNGKAAYGTDSTTGMQACLDQTHSGAIHQIVLTGRYGTTKVKLWPYSVVLGLSQLDFSGFYRMGSGSGGPFIALDATAGSAQGVRLENFYVDCMQIGGTLGGIELGTDAGVRALASGGFLRNIKVKNALGFAFDIRCNVANFYNLWAQQEIALPSGNTTAGGMRFIDTLAYGFQLNAEGNFPAGPFVLNAQSGSVYVGLQLELSGTNASTDAITVQSSQTVIKGVYATVSTYRDLIRIPTGFREVSIEMITILGTYTLTNVLNDIDRAATIPSPGTTTAYLGYWTANSLTFAGQLGLLDQTQWATFAPTWTGFSVNPTVISRYKQIGKTVIWSVGVTANGTSNATTLTATLPVTAKNSLGGAGLGSGMDNSAQLATAVRIDISTTVATFFTTPAAGIWTNSGSKYVQFTLVYEAA